MPQMSPMNWLILFIVFTLIYIFIVIINYFNMMKFNFFSNKTKFNKINWKW